MLLIDQDLLYWMRVSPADKRAFEIFKRHYSYRQWRQRNKKNGNRFVGPGEEITLISKDGKALFVWRKEKFRQDNQTGINCAVFRNESKVLSSVLIQQAEGIALDRWPGERLFTFGKKEITWFNPKPVDRQAQYQQGSFGF
jgi:hypothetical protein